MTAEDRKAVNDLIAERNALAMRVPALEAESAALREEKEQVKAVFLTAGCSDFTDDLAEMARAFCDEECKEWRKEDDYRAIRARAVPPLEWEDFPLTEGEDGPAARALPGAFRIRIYCMDGRFTWTIRIGTNVGGSNIMDKVDMVTAPVTLAEAKSQCKAAFLRLVGCKND